MHRGMHRGCASGVCARGMHRGNASDTHEVMNLSVKVSKGSFGARPHETDTATANAHRRHCQCDHLRGTANGSHSDSRSSHSIRSSSNSGRSGSSGTIRSHAATAAAADIATDVATAK